MKRILPVSFALAFFSSALTACLMDFEQFQPGGGGTAGSGGAGGNCATECCAPTDCATPADPCMAATCNAGTCGTESRPDGTEAGTQTPGDCQKVVCQGGAPASVDDNMDTPDAANDCVSGTCAGGMPVTDPVAAGTACTSNNGHVCDGNGSCVGCLNDGDCPPEAPNCDQGSSLCVSAQCSDGDMNGDETDVDCGGPACAPCAVGDDCNVGTDCASGVCGADKTCQKSPLGAPCSGDGDCDSGQCADGVCCDSGCTAQCQSCNLPGMAGQCVDVLAGTDPDNECAGAAVCDGNGACKKPVGETCANANECSSGFCADGVCCSTACGACQVCDASGSVGTCTNVPNGQDPSNDCAGAQVCDGAGMCATAANGQACANAVECTSGFCTDGVCCESACAGTCQACDIAGTLGTCANIPAGTDPDTECMGANPNCDGNGMCGP